MKAIIMAGGEGSRLRPLTCNRPKPMVPVMNRPIMSHIVDLLKQHQITDIGVTLQYMPEAIKDHFGNGAEYGVNMRYFIEETPLGTAGSVKNAGEFLDETFMVISGDALTDFDLSRAIEFHRQKQAIATLVLTRVECPLEYGVVITNPDGSINKFLEKPAWGEVFSDTVNTGIYILEPEALEYFEFGRVFDFSKDLFPLLLKNKRPLFGVVLDGYWCDIGNLQQYLQAHHDVLSGKVKLNVVGREIAPQVWAGEGVEIGAGTKFTGPVLIGDDCKIGGGVQIEPFTVLGEGCIVLDRSSIKRSVLWSNVYVGAGAALRGAALCNRVQIRDSAGVYEGAVIGDDSVVKERGIIKPDVKLWPNKMVEAGTVVQSSMVWGTRYPKKIFGLEGITGLTNIEMTPEFAVKVAAAFASTFGSGGGLAVSSDNYPASEMIKAAVTSGMQSAGALVFDLGTGITPMHRFAVRAMELKGGIHVKVSPRRVDQVTLVFMNHKGANISRNVERKVENVLMREDFKRTGASRVEPLKKVSSVPANYIKTLTGTIGGSAVKNARPRLVLAYDRANLDNFIKPLAGELSLEIMNIDYEVSGSSARSWQSYRDMMPRLVKEVVEKQAFAGAVLESNGDSLLLVDERGRVISDDLLTALTALVVLKSRGGPVIVPVTAPGAIDDLAQRYQGRVVRTKTAIQDFIERILGQEEIDGQKGISQFLLNFDALGALFCILEFAAGNNVTLGQLVDEIPAFFVDKKEVAVPWETKGTVIRKLIEEPPADRMELLDGVKVFHPQGWALVLPDPEEPVCRVFSEGVSMEIAESLTDFYIDKINKIINSK